MDGIINLLKPSGMTSHDCIYAMRKIINQKKVGHTGTLDPNAIGVLPMLIGKGTKFSQYLIDKEKSYRGTLFLGVETDTEDIYGEIINKIDVAKYEYNQVEAIVSSFLGKQKQIPPMYAALKVNGKKLYELARAGKSIEREARDIEIYDIKLIKYQHPYITIDVTCSKGTYIRTLFKDISKKLNTIGTLSFLMRTRVFNLNIKDSISFEELEFINKEQWPLISIDKMLNFDSYIIKDEEKLKKILQTGYLPKDDKFILGKCYKLFYNNQFIGVITGINRKEKDVYYLKTRI